MTDSSNRVALVTGGARNIGREISLGLARDGIDVVINTQHSIDDAQTLAQEIHELGRRAVVAQGDISQSSEASRLVAESVDAMGQLDIVVLNAAIRRQKPIAEISDEEWQEVLGVALNGAFFMCRAAVPHLVKSSAGRIVFIGGTPSHLGTAGRSHVCAAKMGAIGLMRTLATELGPEGVTSNTVAPGHIDTARGASAGSRSSVTSNRPIGRMGDSNEIAAAVRYLCSPDAAYTTGQTLHVNGGMHFG